MLTECYENVSELNNRKIHIRCANPDQAAQMADEISVSNPASIHAFVPPRTL